MSNEVAVPPDRIEEPWPGQTYKGFSGPAQAPPTRRPAVSRTLIVGGVAGAVALGLVFGLWARPNLATDSSRQPMQAVRQVPTPLSVEVNAPVFTPPPPGDGKLEVLPAELIASAPQPLERQPPPRAEPDPAPAPTPRPPPERRMAALAPPPPQVEAPARAAGPGLACRYGSFAEQMVCDDPRLAAADRQLNRAYDRALRAGVPPRELRADQRDWLEIREDAAHHSPRAVASIYAQRIDELNAIADGDY